MLTLHICIKIHACVLKLRICPYGFYFFLLFPSLNLSLSQNFISIKRVLFFQVHNVVHVSHLICPMKDFVIAFFF